MHKEILDFISVIASIATAITAIVALITVLEMKRQREESHKPEISVNHSILIKIKESDGHIFFNENAFFSEKLLILNIGTGVAKDLKIHYLINFKKLIPLVNELCNKQALRFVGKKSIEFKSLDENFNFSFLTTINEKDSMVNYDFVTNDAQGVYSDFPSVLNKLFSIIFYSIREQIKENKDWDKTKYLEAKTFPVKIVISYKDIGGKKYKKKIHMYFSFEFNIIELQMNGVEENILNARINFC